MTREEREKAIEIIRKYECNAEHYEACEAIIKASEQDSILDKIRADIENMEIAYDKSPNYEDDRTDKEKAVDWFNMDKFLFLQIIDKYREESEDGK